MITGLHHLGHVVRDAAAAIDRYRALGFEIPPPTFPALPADDGTVRAFGAGNTHLRFGRTFVELAVIADSDALPAGARLHPLEAPAEALPSLRTAINETTERLRAALGRFEGLHILAFGATDADSEASRLTAAGIWHGGVHRLRRPRPVEPGRSAVATEAEAIGYLELERSDRSPEGRLAIAETSAAGQSAAHPNGARALAEVLLCVPDHDLDQVADRYRGYLDRALKRQDNRLVADLGDGRLTLVPRSRLAAVLPGAADLPGPSFAGYLITVDDLAATATWLDDHRVPYHVVHGELQVPADWALGAVVGFRQARCTLSGALPPARRSGAGRSG